MTSNGFWHATGLSQRLPITQDLSIAWCWEVCRKSSLIPSISS